MSAYIEPSTYLGTYLSAAALAAAQPSAYAGDLAIVDAGAGSDATLYTWDADAAAWVQIGAGGGGGLSDAELGTDIADTFGLPNATIRGNVISAGGAGAAGLNAAVDKPASDIVSLGEFRVDAGADVAFVVVNAVGDGIAYSCINGQWVKSAIVSGVAGTPAALPFGFGRTASILLTATGGSVLVVEGAVFSIDAIFGGDASVLTLINMASGGSVVYATAGDKYVYDYTGIGLGLVKDVLGRTIKPIGKGQPVGPIYLSVEPGSNPRKYVGFSQAMAFDIDQKIRIQSATVSIGTLSYTGGNVASGALVIVGAGAVVHISTLDCGTADISTVIAVEDGGIVTVSAIIGTGAITDNFNQAPMTETVDGFIRSALTQAH